MTLTKPPLASSLTETDHKNQWNTDLSSSTQTEESDVIKSVCRVREIKEREACGVQGKSLEVQLTISTVGICAASVSDAHNSTERRRGKHPGRLSTSRYDSAHSSCFTLRGLSSNIRWL